MVQRTQIKAATTAPAEAGAQSDRTLRGDQYFQVTEATTLRGAP